MKKTVKLIFSVIFILSLAVLTLGSCDFGSFGEYFCVHKWGEWEVVDQGNCETPGRIQRECSKCGAIIQETTAFKEHEYENYNCVGCGLTSEECFWFTYIQETDSYEIMTVKDRNSLPSNVIIPSTHNGKTVTSIGFWAFNYCSSLTSITIPDSVEFIGDYAFFNCSSLTSVTIPDSVTSIGDMAFYSCTSLIRITIPDSVTSIGGREAFANCYKLSSIEVNENNQYYKSIDGNLYTKDGKTLIQYAIGKKDASFIISDSVEFISDRAFSHCSSLTSVTIPDSVTTIGNHAFSGCSGLASITIPDNVTSIGDWAFTSCSSLTSITIPDSVNSIGDGAFSSCSSLSSIEVNENNQYYKSIDGNLYRKDGKTFIQYAIGKKDTSFVIPNSATSIGERAFFSCDSLTSVTIPDNVTSIGDLAFANCDGLTNITIGNSVTSIGDEMFSGCDSITSITIGNSVTYIDNHAFYCCYKLSSIEVNENNQYYKSIDGNLYTKDGKTLVQYAIGKKDTSFTIPDSVEFIGDYAFFNCSSLTSVTIPDSVTFIGYGAFNDCSSLTSVVIPNSVTSIESFAFNWCLNLTNVYYNGTTEEWDDINIFVDSYTSIDGYTEKSNFSLTNATLYFYSEEAPTTDGNFWHWVGGEVKIWE